MKSKERKPKFERIRVVCSSKGRWDDLLTKKILKTNFTLVVRESEYSQYKAAHPDLEILATPSHIKGIAPTRQWILDQFPGEKVFMIDDDVTKVVRNYEDNRMNYYVEDVEEILDIIALGAYYAEAIGAFTWGYPSTRNPNEYISHRPFRHTGYLNNSHIGFLPGHGLEYALDYGEAEDYYITCLAIYRHRFTFIDTRYSFITKDNFLAKGGVNDIRTTEMMMDNTLKLRKVFGEVVVVKHATANKQKVHAGERSLKFPY